MEKVYMDSVTSGSNNNEDLQRVIDRAIQRAVNRAVWIFSIAMVLTAIIDRLVIK